MTIEEIYQKYSTPPNLQQHMLQVAAVGHIISSNWQNEVNVQIITKTLMIHDIAKIVNFNDPELQKSKEEFIKKYGPDEEEIGTLKIAKELGLEEKGLYILDQMWRINLDNQIQDQDEELKICWYSDWRVAPNGVTPAKERIEELINRSKNKGVNSQEIQRLEGIKIYCLNLEKELQEKIKINLNIIDQDSVNLTVKKIKQYTAFLL